MCSRSCSHCFKPPTGRAERPANRSDWLCQTCSDTICSNQSGKTYRWMMSSRMRTGSPYKDEEGSRVPRWSVCKNACEPRILGRRPMLRMLFRTRSGQWNRTPPFSQNRRSDCLQNHCCCDGRWENLGRCCGHLRGEGKQQQDNMESAVADALSSGVAWNDLGPLKAEARKLKWNKSSWSRAVRQVSPAAAICANCSPSTRFTNGGPSCSTDATAGEV